MAGQAKWTLPLDAPRCLQERGRRVPTSTSVSELHAGSPLCRRKETASDFHWITWSPKTTHHRSRFTQEEIWGRSGG